MTKPDDIARLVAAHPRVDVLVNNVGGMIAADFLKSTDKQWDDSWQLNVMSGVRLSRHYLPGMRERNWGRDHLHLQRERRCRSPPRASPTAR